MTGLRCRPTSTASSVRACATTPPFSPCAARLGTPAEPTRLTTPATLRDRRRARHLSAATPSRVWLGSVRAPGRSPPAARLRRRFLGWVRVVGGAAPVRRLGAQRPVVARPRTTRSTFCCPFRAKGRTHRSKGPASPGAHAEGAECVDSIERDRAGSGWRPDHGRGSSPEGAAAGAAAVSISWSCSSGNPSGSTRSIASAPASSQRRTTSGASS
jgi:hypothetical protein